MVVFSPVIGRGLFCLDGPPSLAVDLSLHHDSGPAFAIISLSLHLLFGGLVGAGNHWLLGD